MPIIGFKISKKLPETAHSGSFLFQALQAVHPLRPQRIYSLQDTRMRDFTHDGPQLVRCSFHGAYNGNIYPLRSIEYFTNTRNDFIFLNKDDVNFANLLNMVAEILGAELVEIEDQDEGYRFISNYSQE